RKTTSVLLVTAAVGVVGPALAIAQERDRPSRQQASEPSTVGVDTFHNFTPPVKAEDAGSSPQANASEDRRGKRYERRRGRESARLRRGETEQAQTSAPARSPEPSTVCVDTFHNLTPPPKTETESVGRQADASEGARGTRYERRRGRAAENAEVRQGK